MQPQRKLTAETESPEPDRDRRVAATVVLSLSLCLLYAVLRYHVFGGVAWAHLPLYTLNKAVSFSSVIVLACAYFTRDRALRKRFGLSGFGLAALHSLMSLALLTPQNYPKIFVENRFNLEGEITVLCGVIPLMMLTFLAVLSVPAVAGALPDGAARNWQALGYQALAITGIHVTAMGLKGWLAPSTWHAGMPPITLLSLVVVALPLVRKAMRHRPLSRKA